MFDSHAHYDDKKFDTDRHELLSVLQSNIKIEGIINAATDIKSCEQIIALSEQYSKLYSAIGVHPHETSEVKESYIGKLKAFAKNEKVVAIGEIGLDFHYDFSPRDIQRRLFEDQMILAEELKLPVIIHDREAHGECVAMTEKFPNVIGVFHSFSGSTETAKILLNKGWYISFNGIITFKNATNLRSVVPNIPDDRLLVETDCPYLAPVPHRGERNNSRHMKHTIIELAQLRGQSFEYIEKITTENAKRLFGIE